MATNTSAGQDASGAGTMSMSVAGIPDVEHVNLTALSADQLYCYLQSASNDYDGGLGVRIAALFVILIVSSAVTFFPVMATRSSRIKVPLYVYLFARYFGAGVIVATAFVQ